MQPGYDPGMPSKKEVAAQLEEAAALMDVLGEDGFRARTYYSAARGIEGYEGDFASLLAGGRFQEIRGVGASLAAELRRLGATGTLPTLARLREEVPEGVRDLFRVSGLGAKRIGQLWRSGIDSLPVLLTAAQDGTLAALKGFGAKSAAGILEAARFAIEAGARLRIDRADALADELGTALRERLPGAEVHVTGELRRRLETVAAVELLVAGAAEDELLAVLTGLADGSVIERTAGPLLELTVLGRAVTVRPVGPEGMGWALFATTGSTAFVAALTGAESATSASGSAGASEVAANGELPPAPSPTVAAAAAEAEVFTLLDSAPVTPELREEAGATEPEGLIGHGDVRGLVHVHTTWSDAVASIREMVAEARRLGYAYLGLADHSRSSAVARGLSIERLQEQAAEVAEVRAELAAEGSDFELLHGIEVDIMPDGSLDYPDEVLELLDYTVVSVHQNFTLSRQAQTERIVTAVRHPLATILAHPTGRLILQRPGYEVDVDAVVAACAEAGTVVEINASPYRLDLDWRSVRHAAARGCLFSIHTDAHSLAGYGDMPYGVDMARKAGLVRSQVITTAAAGREFLARLKTAQR